MRLLIIICILMITLTLQISTVNITPLRQFIEGFLSTINGDNKKIQLSENCLGKNQEEEFNKFLESIQNEHPLLALAMSHKFLADLKLNCPVKEIEQTLEKMKIVIFNDNQNIFNVIYSQAGNLLGIFEDFELEIQKKTELNEKAETVGKFVGKTFNKILYENDNIHNNLKFLVIPESTPSYQDSLIKNQDTNRGDLIPSKSISARPMELFVDGFFEGVSSVPYEHNKCHTDILEVKSDIVAAFENLINAIKNETGVIDAMMKMYELLSKLKGLDANCHFEALSIDIMALTTKIGAAKLLYRISTHLMSTMADINSMYTDMKLKDYRGCGVSFGMLLKTALNYSTI